MGKIIRLRIYRVQDYDLYRLYYDKNFHLVSKIKEALSAYANGRELPVFDVSGVGELKKGKKNTIVISIWINDEDAYELVHRIPDRNINNFIKALVRRTFANFDYLYFDAEDVAPAPMKPITNPVTRKPAASSKPAPKKEEKIEIPAQTPIQTPVQETPVTPTVPNIPEPSMPEPKQESVVPQETGFVLQPSFETYRQGMSPDHQQIVKPQDTQQPANTPAQAPQPAAPGGLYGMINQFEV